MTPTLFLAAALCAAAFRACMWIGPRTTLKHETALVALCFATGGVVSLTAALACCIFGELPR